jgi:hypothetical protein
MLSDYEKSQEICNLIGHRWEDDADGGKYCPNCNQWEPQQCRDCGAYIIDGCLCFWCEIKEEITNQNAGFPKCARCNGRKNLPVFSQWDGRLVGSYQCPQCKDGYESLVEDVAVWW